MVPREAIGLPFLTMRVGHRDIIFAVFSKLTCPLFAVYLLVCAGCDKPAAVTESPSQTNKLAAEAPMAEKEPEPARQATKQAVEYRAKSKDFPNAPLTPPKQ